MNITKQFITSSMPRCYVIVHQYELWQKHRILRPRIVNYGRIGNDDVSRSWFR